MKKIILFFSAVLAYGAVRAQNLPAGISFQTPDVQTPHLAPLGLTMSTTTSFNQNQAMASFGVQRKKYVTAQPSGNDMTDEVSIWIKGYYQNTGVALPVILGGYGFSSEDGHMIIDRNGSVGIGTLGPGSFSNQNQVNYPQTYSVQDRVLSVISAKQPVLELGRPVSTLGAGERIGAIFFSNTDGQEDAHRQVAGLWAEKTDVLSHPHLSGGKLVFATKVHGGPSHNKMTFDEFGNLSIGTAASGGYKLAVNGDVKARKVRVTVASSEWPDFVFSHEYKLKSLEELDAYISKYKHLPGIPSATEVQEQGVELGETQARLLQKIEELTLHMIDMNKKMSAQEKLIQGQEQRLEQQERIIDALKHQTAQ